MVPCIKAIFYMDRPVALEYTQVLTATDMRANGKTTNLAAGGGQSTAITQLTKVIFSMGNVTEVEL